MIKLSIGIPVYGTQGKDWWGPLARQTAEYYKDGIELVNILAVGSMMTDVNRNHIVDQFLESDSEWLRWLDADNVDRFGSVRRLLETQKSFVTGIYTKRNESGENIAYFSAGEGEYTPVDGYTPGEIFPIDAAGMGGCLVHRSVFEDIQRNYIAFDMTIGGMITINTLDMIGDVFDDELNPTDNRVVDGQYRIRLRVPKIKKPFPYFMLNFGRTEDYGFCEMAARSGHRLWLDTGVEIGHIGEKTYTPADVRERDLIQLRLK